MISDYDDLVTIYEQACTSFVAQLPAYNAVLNGINNGYDTRNSIYSVPNVKYSLVQSALTWLRFNDFVKYNVTDGKFSITDKGLKFMKYYIELKKLDDLFDFIENTEPSSIMELDMNLTLAGRHDLIDHDVTENIIALNTSTFTTGTLSWVAKYVLTVHQSRTSVDKFLEKLPKSDFCMFFSRHQKSRDHG